MRRYFFGFILAPTLLFALVIGVIRARPYVPGQLEVLLNPPAGCPSPCFLGVRPGQTTTRQALAILRANDQISEVEVINRYDDQVIYWHWGTEQDAYPRYGFRVQDNVVTELVLPPTITLGELQLALGEPAVVNAAFTNDFIQQPAFVFEYPSGLYIFVKSYLCEIDQQTFWQLSLQSPSTYNHLFIDLGDAPYFRMVPETRQTLDRDSWAKEGRDFCRAGHT